MKRVLLTGVGGAIAVHAVAHLMHNTDWEIVGIDSFRHKGQYDRLTRVCRNHPDWLPRLTVIAHDLTVKLTERQVAQLGEIDIILNLASLSDVQASIEDPEPFVRNNHELMLQVLQLARVIRPEVLLHLSTDEVYGPCAKDSSGHPEWSPIRPSNPYSASKAAQEALASAWWRSYDVPVVIVNTMNNFAEMQAPSKYPAKVQQHVALGRPVPVHVDSAGQAGTRYYIHSRNTADALLFILRETEVYHHRPGEIDEPQRWNVVGDRQIDNAELARLIAAEMGERVTLEPVAFHGFNPGHDLHYGLDGSKLRAAGWTSPVSFEDSLRNTIEWQKRNPEWMR